MLACSAITVSEEKRASVREMVLKENTNKELVLDSPMTRTPSASDSEKIVSSSVLGFKNNAVNGEV